MAVYPPPPCPIEDRIALEDLATAYCNAVDRIGDIDGVLAVFAPDAVYDLTGFGLGVMEGHAAIRAFYAGAFPTMAGNAHYASNFALAAFAGDTASASVHVHAFSKGTDGSLMEVKVRYLMDARRDPGTWRITRLSLELLLPA
ncbi:nuclear transport factor 2 family protein [Novosphingobium sp.]|uniref:nuclear transport factor 2 family protein n=1 Tax=Novosphingobium sp. TaxID=1874826 RepID=UPI0025ECF9CF|nr:nuclear transport factor 2 family protein [Novosphingobium sp.]